MSKNKINSMLTRIDEKNLSDNLRNINLGLVYEARDPDITMKLFIEPIHSAITNKHTHTNYQIVL